MKIFNNLLKTIFSERILFASVGNSIVPPNISQRKLKVEDRKNTSEEKENSVKKTAEERKLEKQKSLEV